MGIKETVGRRILVARAEQRMTQVRLAELVGTDQRYISKLEMGAVNVGVETLERVAAALQKPMAYFFLAFEQAEVPKAQSPAARAKKRKAA